MQVRSLSITAATVDQLRALAERQKEHLQQQSHIMTAREQRLHYLQQQMQRDVSKTCLLPRNGEMRDRRMKELRAAAFGNRLQRRSDSCTSDCQYCNTMLILHVFNISRGM